MKKVLITGTMGFIFGRFVRQAIYRLTEKNEYKFVSLDRMSDMTRNSLYTNKHHDFYPADIRDQHMMDVIFQFEQPDIVIHGAAETFVDTSLKDPNSFVSCNVAGTQNIINSCVKYGVKRLIYISTDEVYGQLTTEQDPPWTEGSPMAPRNPYSASKASGELFVQAAYHTHGLIYNITRSSNNYGPWQLPEKLLPKAIKCILDKKPIPLYGEGKQIRDWTYVDDNCSAILTILDKGEPNEIYNISAHQEFTNIEVIHEACNVMNTGHDLISFIPDPRPGHDFRYSIDTTKIQKLGWKPTVKFKDGIKETVAWYTHNAQWFLK